MQHHYLAFLILLHKFWSLTWIDRLSPLLNFLHNFSNFLYNFFWLILFNPWELCLFLIYFYVSLFFFIHFPLLFSTQVYRGLFFYIIFQFFFNYFWFSCELCLFLNIFIFLIHFHVFFHHFCFPFFMQLHFCLTSLTTFQKVLSLTSVVIAAYISGVCSHRFLQVSCVIIFGIEEGCLLSILYCTLFIILHTLFWFWHKSTIFLFLFIFQFFGIILPLLSLY